jgi:hypothetical protein
MSDAIGTEHAYMHLLRNPYMYIGMGVYVCMSNLIKAANKNEIVYYLEGSIYNRLGAATIHILKYKAS